MNKGVCAVILLVIVMAALTGATTQAVMVVEGQTNILTLQDAVAIAFESNYDIQKARLEIAKLEVDIEDMLKNPGYSTQRQNLEKTRDSLLESLDISLARLPQTIEESYYNVVSMHRQLDVQQRNVDNLQRRYDMELIRLQQGNATELAVESMRISVESSLMSLDKYTQSVVSAEMSFNVLLGRPIDTPVNLVWVYEYSPELLSIEETLSKALNPQYGTLRRVLDTHSDASELFSELKLKYNNFYHPMFQDYRYADLPEVQKAKIDLQTAELNLTQTLCSTEIAVRNKFNDVIAAEKAVAIAQQELELERRKLIVEEKKYDVGLSAQSAVIDQVNKVTTKEIDLVAKMYAYKKALLTLHFAEIGL